jgi:uncharacterized protein (DUF433 family)
MGGKPRIKGTRIPVDLIPRYLGDGQSTEDILEAFPGLTVEDVQAAAAFAADVMADEAMLLRRSMKLLADECFDRRLAVRVRSEGHDVVRVPAKSGLDDLAVATRAEREDRLLLMQDTDFGPSP